MNEILIFFGTMFIALIFEILLSIFWYYKGELNDVDDSNIVAVLVVLAVINAIVIAVIATVRYSS